MGRLAGRRAHLPGGPPPQGDRARQPQGADRRSAARAASPGGNAGSNRGGRRRTPERSRPRFRAWIPTRRTPADADAGTVKPSSTTVAVRFCPGPPALSRALRRLPPAPGPAPRSLHDPVLTIRAAAPRVNARCVRVACTDRAGGRGGAARSSPGGNTGSFIELGSRGRVLRLVDTWRLGRSVSMRRSTSGAQPTERPGYPSRAWILAATPPWRSSRTAHGDQKPRPIHEYRRAA